MLNAMIKQSTLRWLAGLLLVLLLPGVIYAQDDISDDEVNAVAKEIYCPVCEGTPLDVCPTLACADWRELIRVQLSEGATREEIYEYFARQYGDGVLANPPRRGISLIVLWVLPVLGILLGLLLFVRLLRSLRSQAPQAAQTAVPPPVTPRPASAGGQSLDDYIARVEREVGE